jgi:phosphate transport system substrate-binding protein
MKRCLEVALLLGLLSLGLLPPAAAQELWAAGATFPFPIYAKWFDSFSARHPGIAIHYQPVGSETGIQRLKDGAVDFAASDMPLSDQQIAQFSEGVLHFPSVLGGVVPIYNLPSVPRDLRFTPETLAGIFLGRIRRWNDPALRTPNRGVRLPDSEIVVVHRSDGSGTSYVWTDYLAKVNPEWRRIVGSGSSVNWPAGVGAEFNEGVVKRVGGTPNTIGYVEYIFAVQNRLSYGLVRNAAGKFVQADLATIPKAVPAQGIPDDMRVSITNAADPGAYPVAAFSYFLIPAHISSSGKKQAITAFLEWMLTSGQHQSAALGYAPLPDTVIAREREALTKIR